MWLVSLTTGLPDMYSVQGISLKAISDTEDMNTRN